MRHQRAEVVSGQQFAQRRGVSGIDCLRRTAARIARKEGERVGADVGIELIAGLLNEVLRPEQTTTVLLETMAGKGTEVGRTFEELAAIIERVELSDHMGVCLDTCHVHDGGYDIVNNLDGVLDEFNRVIGIERLRAALGRKHGHDA